jgi:hypothetical protein
MKRSLTFLSFIYAVLFCATSFAQVQQPDYSNFGFSSAKINGRIQVSRFDYNVPSLGATSFAAWSNFPNGCRYDIPGYGASVPFNTSATVKVNDLTTPANTETVNLTAFTSAAPTCALTLSTVNQHTGSYVLQSGTCGLKEAVNIFGGSAANYEIGQEFYSRGCSASTITSVTGAASGSILVDSSNGVWVFYVSNGTNFIKNSNPVMNTATQQITTNGTAIAAGTCQSQPTISIPGLTTSSTLTWSSSAALPATWQTGIQVEFDVSTAGTAKVWLCNPTAGSITPAALAMNVKALQ